MTDRQYSIHRNADNEDLMPRSAGRFLIGYVDEVHGPGAREIPGYVPTRDELTLLVEHWAWMEVDRTFRHWFMLGEASSTDSRLIAFAASRINRVAKLVGDDFVNKIVSEVHDHYRRSSDIDERTWHIFKHGDRKQWDEFQDEVMRKAFGDEPQDEAGETPRKDAEGK
jgi:hypothetical protein